MQEWSDISNLRLMIPTPFSMFAKFSVKVVTEKYSKIIRLISSLIGGWKPVKNAIRWSHPNSIIWSHQNSILRYHLYPIYQTELSAATDQFVAGTLEIKICKPLMQGKHGWGSNLERKQADHSNDFHVVLCNNPDEKHAGRCRNWRASVRNVTPLMHASNILQRFLEQSQRTSQLEFVFGCSMICLLVQR